MKTKKKKKDHHVRGIPNFDPKSDKKQKKGQNDNGLILARVSINRLLGLGRVRVMPYYSAEYSDSTRHIPRNYVLLFKISRYATAVLDCR